MFVFVNMNLYICISLFIYIYIYRSSFSFIYIYFFYITYIHHMRECRYNPEFDNVATTTMDSLHFFCRNPWNWRMTRSRWMAAEPHHRSALVVNDPVLARAKLQKGWLTKSGEVFFWNIGGRSPELDVLEEVFAMIWQEKKKWSWTLASL